MITIRTTLAAVCTVLAFSAASQAGAQTPEPSPAVGTLEEIPTLVAELSAKLLPLAESIGIDVSDLTRQLEPMMRGAFPTPPGGDAKWAYSFTFDNSTVVTDSGAVPEGRKTVLADAQACAALYPLAGPVVHFRRIHRDGLTGHQCILRTYEDSMGVLISETYAEGADRHMSASYVAAGSVENDPDAANALFEPVVDTNIGLAVELADLALESAIRAIPGGTD